MFDYIGWKEVGQLITRGYERAIDDKIVTYDFARLMEGAREVRTSEFASAIIERM
jgi:isocitrate dehydrogenase